MATGPYKVVYCNARYRGAVNYCLNVDFRNRK